MSVMGKRSLANPGSIPVVKHEAPPSLHASVMGSIHDGGFLVMWGQTHGVMAVEQTSIPARRKAPIWRMLTSALAAVGP